MTARTPDPAVPEWPACQAPAPYHGPSEAPAARRCERGANYCSLLRAATACGIRRRARSRFQHWHVPCPSVKVCMRNDPMSNRGVREAKSIVFAEPKISGRKQKNRAHTQDRRSVCRGSGRKNELSYTPPLWSKRYWYASTSSIQGLEYNFQHPTTSFTHTAYTSTCRFF